MRSPSPAPPHRGAGDGLAAAAETFFLFDLRAANQFTATRSDVGSVAASWERAIPCIPLTIVPYWSLVLLYGLSL